MKNLLPAITLILATACGYGGPPPSGPAAPNTPNSNDNSNNAALMEPTFTNVFNVVLSQGCGCHSSGAGGLSMPNKAAAYANLVGKDAHGPCAGRPLVAANEAGRSVLLSKLSGDGLCGARMPIGGVVDAEEVDLIERWIAAGAPNN